MWSETKDINQSINPRDFIERLDSLIKLRVEASHCINPTVEEECEILKRELTDYLLETSAQHGIYAKGDKQ